MKRSRQLFTQQILSGATVSNGTTADRDNEKRRKDDVTDDENDDDCEHSEG